MRNVRETNRASLPSSLHLSSRCQELLSGSSRTPPLLATHLPIHPFLEDNRKLEALSKPKTNLENNKTLTFHESIFAVVFWQGRGHTEENKGEGTCMTKSEATISYPPPPLSHFPGSFQKRDSFLFRKEIQRQL